MTAAGALPAGARAGLSAARRWSRLVVLLTALIALSWQTFVAQGHHHLPPLGSGTAITGAAAHPGVSRDRPAPDTSDDCPLCQHVAHAGVLLVPEAVALRDHGLVPHGSVAPATVAAFVTDRRSHAWQSRAPPRPFQA